MYAEHNVLGIEISDRCLKGHAKGMLGVGALLILILGLLINRVIVGGESGPRARPMLES